ESALPRLPLIDPDLIGPDDIRSPFPQNTVFDLWLARRGFVDTALKNLRAAREGDPTNGLTTILKLVLGDPLPDLDSLLQDLTQGDKGTVAAASDSISKLNLTVDSFNRLMEIRAKDRQAHSDPRILVSDDEWSDVYSILTQAKKVGNLGTWRDDEKNVIFGLKDFWISLREPAEGDWPPAVIGSGTQTP